LVETSGMAASLLHTGVYYAVNDGPETPIVYAMDETGKVLHTVDIQGVETTQAFGKAGNGDWEGVATGPCDQGGLAATSDGPHCIFIADTGHNCARVSEKCNYNRKVYSILRLPEPESLKEVQSSIHGKRFWYRYPNNIVHDAESLLMTPDGQIYVVTKVDSGASTVYWIPTLEDGNTVEAQKVAEVTAPLDGSPMFTDADFAIGKDNMVIGITLRTYTHVVFYPMRPGKGVPQEIKAAFSGQPCNLPAPVEKQGEVLVWNRPQSAFFVTTSEASGSAISKVRCTNVDALAKRAPSPEQHRSASFAATPLLTVMAVLSLIPAAL